MNFLEITKPAESNNHPQIGSPFPLCSFSDLEGFAGWRMQRYRAEVVQVLQHMEGI
jgi:hypothetical protein